MVPDDVSTSPLVGLVREPQSVTGNVSIHLVTANHKVTKTMSEISSEDKL